MSAAPNHAERAHAEFSASSSARLIECPGSFALERKLYGPHGQARSSSAFAAEGTLAHELAEAILRDPKHSSTREYFEHHKLLGAKRTVDGHEITITDEMEDGVELYVDQVRTLAALGFDVALEQRVAPVSAFPKGEPPVSLFGTADCVGWKLDATLGHLELVVIDLKFGRGVAVDPENNSQLLYYALGAMCERGWCPGGYLHPGIKTSTVHLVIVQPRAPHPKGAVRQWRTDAAEIAHWGRNTLLRAVARVLEPDAPLMNGAHCRFCPTLAQCPKIFEAAREAARHAFDDLQAPPTQPPPVSLLSAPEISALLPRLDALEDWIAAVRGEAHDRLAAGVAVPGYKLVAKRATRRWDDEDKLRAALVGVVGLAGFAELSETTLLSPARMESAVKRNHALAAARPVMDAHMTANSSGTTLVPAIDPRPAVAGRQDAADVFDNF